jgi:hypothetical protein
VLRYFDLLHPALVSTPPPFGRRLLSMSARARAS